MRDYRVMEVLAARGRLSWTSLNERSNGTLLANVTSPLNGVTIGGRLLRQASRRQTFRLRHPVVPAAAALAAGILADHWLPIYFSAWLLMAVGFACLWGLMTRMGQRAVAAGCLLFWIACLGGGRHHLFWSTVPSNDISAFTGTEPRLVRLSGTLADQPEIVSPSGKTGRRAWVQGDTTMATLRCHRIVGDKLDMAVSGRAALRVKGHVLHANVGDEIEIIGWLVCPSPLRNPGGDSPADYLRRQQIRCLVSADHPDAVHSIHQDSSLSVWRWAARLREKGEELLARDLSARNAPVAAALLFGSRSQMEEEIREAFIESGLMHVLTVSGMHVAILSLLLWGVSRVLGVSDRGTVLVAIFGVVGYTFLTDCRPPIIRATILVCLYASTRFWYRRPQLPNCLAQAAIGILLWNPSDLFDIGTQLSFLAVLGILWGSSWIRQIERRDPLRRMAQRYAERGTIHKSADNLWKMARDGWLISIAVALFTMPLVAARFHLVSPIGIVINVVLAPISTVVLWLGYIHIGIGFLIPWISSLAAVPFDLGMSLVLKLVEMSARVKLSHAYVPGPPDWWLAGYYALLFTFAFVHSKRRWGSRGWSELAAWSILGLVCGLRSPGTNGLRCTFLSVGHGAAILLEMPSGRTLLYDAGAMQDERIAQRAVQSTLWDRRHSGIDAIIVSHADVDHFNGVTGLMQTIPVGQVLVSQQFLDFRQGAVAKLCDASSACGVPIKLIHKGDRIRLDDRVGLSIRHPPPGRPHSDDNANSVVLLIEYAGRRILLTGDLDGVGQAALLQSSPVDADVLLAPHHGSKKANTAALAAWARAEYVVVSAGRRVDMRSLQSAYGPTAEILSTSETGAVTFEIHPDGRMDRTTFRPVARAAGH